MIWGSSKYYLPMDSLNEGNIGVSYIISESRVHEFRDSKLASQVVTELGNHAVIKSEGL